MNPLTELREDLANTLSEAGIRAFGYAEPKLVPPCAAIVPNSDYLNIREGDVFGQTNIAIDILLLGVKATERAGSEKMDDLILKALHALSDEFDVTGVTAPGIYNVNGAELFSCIISVEVQINLTEGSK